MRLPQTNSRRTPSGWSHQVSTRRRLCRGRLFKPLNPLRNRSYMQASSLSRVGSLEEFSQSSSTTVQILMDSGIVSSDVRELCKAVSEEEVTGRMKLLLDALYDELDERQLMAALL